MAHDITGQNYIVRYDEDTQVLFAIYGDIVKAETVMHLYIACERLIRTIGEAHIRGLILDYRRVEQFEKGSLETEQREGTALHHKKKLDEMPMALVAETLVQTQLVNVILRLTPNARVKRHTTTLADALAHIEHWHNQNAVV